MADLVRPLEMFWQWLEGFGGYPGKIMFVSFLVMLVVLGFTWYSNRSG